MRGAEASAMASQRWVAVLLGWSAARRPRRQAGGSIRSTVNLNHRDRLIVTAQLAGADNMSNPLESNDDVRAALDRHDESKPDIEQPAPDRGAKVSRTTLVGPPGEKFNDVAY